MNIFLEAVKNKYKKKEFNVDKYVTAKEVLRIKRKKEHEDVENRSDDDEKEIMKKYEGRQPRSSSLKTHLKQGVVAGGAVLAGYAALKIKAMRCKKRCEEITDPEKKGNCLERC